MLIDTASTFGVTARRGRKKTEKAGTRDDSADQIAHDI